MQFLSNKLRSIPWTYHFVRRNLMAYRRWRFGLKHVHSTFYMARGCLVTSDLVAHEYSFLNIGCILGPKVTANIQKAIFMCYQIAGDQTTPSHIKCGVHVFKPKAPAAISHKVSTDKVVCPRNGP